MKQIIPLVALHCMIMAVGLHYEQIILIQDMLLSMIVFIVGADSFDCADSANNTYPIMHKVFIVSGVILRGVGVFYIIMSLIKIASFAHLGAWQ